MCRRGLGRRESARSAGADVVAMDIDPAPSARAENGGLFAATAACCTDAAARDVLAERRHIRALVGGGRPGRRSGRRIGAARLKSSGRCRAF